MMTYSFVAGNRVTKGRMIAGARMAAGTPIMVSYVPSNSADSWVVGHEPELLPSWLGALLGVIGVVSACFILGAVRRQRYLLSGGRAAIARVTAARPKNGPRGHHYTELRFEFRLMNGAARTGKVRAGPTAPAVGMEFIVVYDPEQPNRVARYPLTLVRTHE